MSYQCPVCNKVAKTPIDLVRHMMGRGDKDHREWISTRGFDYAKMLTEQAISFGGAEYKRFAEALEKETEIKE
ncbi:MAG: hypothetical protein JW712_14435 [Dehalococcoidales bacterium]|nr:hypothetical protein [Dehalococcoidales bacterium]